MTATVIPFPVPEDPRLQTLKPYFDRVIGALSEAASIYLEKYHPGLLSKSEQSTQLALTAMAMELAQTVVEGLEDSGNKLAGTPLAFRDFVERIERHLGDAVS